MSRQYPKGVYKAARGDKFRAIIWDEDTYEHNHLGTFETPEEAIYARKLAVDGHHWGGLEPDTSKWGFIYLITNNITGKMYIGQKRFYKWQGPQGGYKCTDPNDPAFIPSAWGPMEWETYVSSCKPLQLDMQSIGVHNFSFEILEHADNNLDLNLKEINEQVERDVLKVTDPDGNYLYYNGNIGGWEFKAPFNPSEVERSKLASKTAVDMYYLKPLHCNTCGSVLPFGSLKCEVCNV